MSQDLPQLAFPRDQVRKAGVVNWSDLGVAMVSAGGGVVGIRTAGVGELELGTDSLLREAVSGAAAIHSGPRSLGIWTQALAKDVVSAWTLTSRSLPPGPARA